MCLLPSEMLPDIFHEPRFLSYYAYPDSSFLLKNKVLKIKSSEKNADMFEERSDKDIIWSFLKCLRKLLRRPCLHQSCLEPARHSETN